MMVIVALLIVLIVWFIYFIYFRKFRKLRACTWNDSWCYKRSIENALEAEHPAKIVFILNNTFAQLNRLGLTEYSSYSKQAERQNTKSQQLFMETFGIPSSRKLKDAIDLAEEFCEQWEEITRRGGKAAQIQAMDRIKQVFSSEFFYLDYVGTSSNVYCKKDQKSYAYEWDGKVTSENIQEQWKTLDYNIGYYYKTGNTHTQDKSTAEAEPLRKNNNSKRQAINNSPVNDPSPPPQRVLTFEEFLQQHPGLFYLTEPEQREEYHKYLASMGVQPISPTTRPYDPDHSNSVPKNTEDDNVW